MNSHIGRLAIAVAVGPAVPSAVRNLGEKLVSKMNATL